MKTIIELIEELQDRVAYSTESQYDSFLGAVRNLSAYRDGTAIQVTWAVEDVMEALPKLGSRQVQELLQTVADNHDCNYGITWDIFKFTQD